MTDTQATNLPEKTVELEETQTANAPEACPEQPEANALQPTETEAETAPVRLTKAEILERLKAIAEHVEETAKAEIDSLKQTFYKLHNAQQESAKRAFIEGGGAPEAYTPQADPEEEEFKQVMSVIKEKRNAANAELEQQKEMNLQVKLSIIDELKELLEYGVTKNEVTLIDDKGSLSKAYLRLSDDRKRIVADYNK